MDGTRSEVIKLKLGVAIQMPTCCDGSEQLFGIGLYGKSQDLPGLSFNSSYRHGGSVIFCEPCCKCTAMNFRSRLPFGWQTGRVGVSDERVPSKWQSALPGKVSAGFTENYRTGRTIRYYFRDTTLVWLVGFPERFRSGSGKPF